MCGLLRQLSQHVSLGKHSTPPSRLGAIRVGSNEAIADRGFFAATAAAGSDKPRAARAAPANSRVRQGEFIKRGPYRSSWKGSNHGSGSSGPKQTLEPRHGSDDGRPVTIAAHGTTLPCRSRPGKRIGAVPSSSRDDNCSGVVSGDVLPEESTCRTYRDFRLRGLIRTMASAFRRAPAFSCRPQAARSGHRVESATLRLRRRRDA